MMQNASPGIIALYLWRFSREAVKISVLAAKNFEILFWYIPLRPKDFSVEILIK